MLVGFDLFREGSKEFIGNKCDLVLPCHGTFSLYMSRYDTFDGSTKYRESCTFWYMIVRKEVSDVQHRLANIVLTIARLPRNLYALGIQLTLG